MCNIDNSVLLYDKSYHLRSRLRFGCCIRDLNIKIILHVYPKCHLWSPGFHSHRWNWITSSDHLAPFASSGYFATLRVCEGWPTLARSVELKLSLVHIAISPFQLSWFRIGAACVLAAALSLSLLLFVVYVCLVFALGF